MTSQIDKLRTKFGLEQVIWVGDRGIISSTTIKEEFKSLPGLDWIGALKANQIRSLSR